MTVDGGCVRGLMHESLASPSSIPLTVIAKQGFRAGPPLFAAPSLVDLLGLLHGVGVYPDLDECDRFRDLRDTCWLDVQDPGNSLMVAALVDEPCMLTNSITAALVTTTEIGISVANSGSCPKGEPPGPNLSLLAIPLRALPSDEITVILQHPGIPAHTAKMMVDLRQPLDIHTDVRVRATEVISSIESAERDAIQRVPPGHTVTFQRVGTNRWSDTALGCSVEGQTYQPADAKGFVVFMRGSDQPQLAMEYHVSGPTVVFCGRVAY